ncbi:MAG TPA: hypothetical protein VFH85_04250 [Gammaproteobacteria bacterium]|nr:hypothetical protein [Gammaproteobacteria bacterium]
MSHLPVSLAEASAAPPGDDWRRAGQRAEQYLAALGVDPAERRHMAGEAVTRAAAESGWASGRGATALTMIALHQALTDRHDEPLEATDDLMADSAQARLLRWLSAAKPEGAPPVESDANAHVHLASMPPMERTNMAPARIVRRPAPLRWLRRMVGAAS